MSTSPSLDQLFQNKQEPSGSSYEDVPYESYSFPQSHPRRLATIARLLGLNTPDIETCRVLELACSGGGNLIPMAEHFPNGKFVGVDSSRVAVAEANATIDALKLPNVEVHQKNILEVDRDLGEFDYIIAHGVFSWVPAPVRDKIFAICSQQLAPNGVAYISYNANPGWRLRGTIRDVMRYRAQFFSKPEERLQQGRALLNFLAKSVPAKDNMYGQLLNDELRAMQKSADFYLMHEFLEDDNVAMYFHEFIESAQRFNLQYVGESDYSAMSVNNFSPEVSRMLCAISSDAIQMEQYMDFVRNRTFRQTLLCHRDVTLNRSPSPEIVRSLYISSQAAPNAPITNLLNNDEVRFQCGRCAMTTAAPLIKTVMLELYENFPAYLSFSELMYNVRLRLNRLGWKSDASDAENEEIILGMLLHAYSTMVIDLTVQRWSVCLRPSKTPVASPVARYQATKSPFVANLGHITTPLNGLQRYILGMLDGTHDRDALITHLYEHSKNDLSLKEPDGSAITDVGRIHQVLANVLDEALRYMAAHSLLVS